MCRHHGGQLPGVKKAARRRRWTAYATISPVALDVAYELLKSRTLSVNARARLAAAVLEFAASDPDRSPALQ